METEEVSKEYLKGFNNGYLLAQYEPGLAAMLTKSVNGKNEYFQGLTHGQQLYDKEKLHEHFRGQTHNKPQSKEIDRDRGEDK